MMQVSSFKGFCVRALFVEKFSISKKQIPEILVDHRNPLICGSSKFRSWPDISMTKSSGGPRCWGSMNIYIGYFHPKYNFHIFHKNVKYKISSRTVYFYRARYCTFCRGRSQNNILRIALLARSSYMSLFQPETSGGELHVFRKWSPINKYKKTNLFLLRRKEMKNKK